MSILFELERTECLTVDLDQFHGSVETPVSCYKRMEREEDGNPWCNARGWRGCAIEEPWGCLDSHRWYRTAVEIPPRLGGVHVEFLITTGGKKQWGVVNPQTLFYLDGRTVQGVDVEPQRNSNKFQGQYKGTIQNCHSDLQW